MLGMQASYFKQYKVMLTATSDPFVAWEMQTKSILSYHYTAM